MGIIVLANRGLGYLIFDVYVLTPPSIIIFNDF